MFGPLSLGHTAERVEGRQTRRAALNAPAGEADPILSGMGGDQGVTWRILPLAAPGEAVEALLLAGDPVAEPVEEAPVIEPVEVEPVAETVVASERLRGGQDFNPLLAVTASARDMMLNTADDPARVKRLGQAALVAGQRGGALTLRSADPVMQSAA